MKKSLLFLLLPLSVYADFTSVDSQNLSNTLQGVEAIRGNQVTLYELLQNFTTYSSSWGGHFIKTVGNAASKFLQEFNSNGWFPAVKASIGVIQADVGRINTALTTVNDHLEIIEGDVSSIKDTTESIDTTITSMKYLVDNIDSNVDRVGTAVSSLGDNIILIKDYLNPEAIWAEGGFSWAWGFTLNRLATEYKDALHSSDFIDLSVSIDDSQVWSSRIEQYLQALTMLGSSDNEIFVNSLLRESIIQYTQIASTNLLQKILDTNDVWYAKIYDRIPTNLTVVVSNIASNASNDWRYTAATALSSAPVLHDLTPSRERDIKQSFALAPPQLTGDFRADVILLLGNMQQIASSSASVDLDILTNVQVVAGSILSASAEVSRQADETRQNADNIASEGQSHEHDLDSAESYFDIHDSNTDVYKNLSTFANLPSKFTPLVVSHVADNYTIEVPSFSVYDSGSSDPFFIEMDISRFKGYFDSVRSCFAVFWFGFAFFIVWKFLLLGVRLLGWISSLINPFQFNSGVQGHDLSSFHG